MDSLPFRRELKREAFGTVRATLLVGREGSQANSSGTQGFVVCLRAMRLHEEWAHQTITDKLRDSRQVGQVVPVSTVSARTEEPIIRTLVSHRFRTIVTMNGRGQAFQDRRNYPGIDGSSC